MKRTQQACLVAALLLGSSAAFYAVNNYMKNASLRCDTPRKVATAFGSEKAPLYRDPDWVELHRKGCWEVQQYSVGSQQMVDNYLINREYDVLWPAGDDQVADLSKGLGFPVNVELRANTPLVLITSVASYDALVKASAVTVSSTGKATMSPKWLVDKFEAGARWTDFGVKFDNWPMRFSQTHPAQSNSGRNMSAIIANTMAKSSSVQVRDLSSIREKLSRYYQGGELKASTGDLFNQFIQTGGQTHPVIVAYEFEVVEAYQDAKTRGYAAAFDQIRVVYLEGTLVNANPLVAVADKDDSTDDGADYRAFLAENAPEVERILQAHGFRLSDGGNSVGTAHSAINSELQQIGIFLDEPISYTQQPQPSVVDAVVGIVLEGRCEVLTPSGNLELEVDNPNCR